jgi:hypothetical protein
MVQGLIIPVWINLAMRRCEKLYKLDRRMIHIQLACWLVRLVDILLTVVEVVKEAACSRLRPHSEVPALLGED